MTLRKNENPERPMRNLRPILLLTALVLASGAAHAGQSPYVATVGDECAVPDFYLSPKHQQFTHAIDAAFALPEEFGTSAGITSASEQCNVDFAPGATNPNWHLPNRNEGSFHWIIQLPGKPQGNLDITIQCGLLKPNTEIFGMLLCAGETGERVDAFCERDFLFDQPGLNPVNPSWMPSLAVRAIASDGSWLPFHLTAYRNAGDYSLTGGTTMTNSNALQILDGSSRSRVQLQSCMTKTVNLKLPVTGQLNAQGETEIDLGGLDLIDVRLAFPRGHTMDVYCHAQSVSVRGNLDPQSLLGARCSGP